MYIGRYYHRLESKGRISLPVKFREQLKEGAVLTKGLDKSLAIYDQEAWQQKIKAVENLSQTKKANRDYIRYLTNDAQEVEVDGQGRIHIDEHLQTVARLSKEVVFVGSLDHIEIWDQETYHEYIKEVEDSIEDQVEEIDVRNE